MTSRTGATSVGLRASAASSSSKQRSGHIRFGVLVAASSPSWSARAGRREKVFWLPPPHVPWFDPKTGKPSPVFYQFMREVAENRLGGVQGVTITSVDTAVTETRTEVVNTTAYATAVAVYAEGVAATATATAQVAQNNSLTGSSSIPSTPEPPERTGGSGTA